MVNTPPQLQTDLTVRAVRHRAVDRAPHGYLRRSQPSTKAGDAAWRHRLMSLGHDPLKPV